MLELRNIRLALVAFCDDVLLIVATFLCLGSIRGVFGPMSKISFTLSNYRFVIWDKNYWRYFVI